MTNREQQLRLNLLEITTLLTQATRPDIIQYLQQYQSQTQQALQKLVAQQVKLPVRQPDPLSRPYKPITRFAWEQNPKQVKIYVTSLQGLKEHPKQNISLNSTQNSIDFTIDEFKGENYRLRFQRLAKAISGCNFTLKSNGFSLTLKKAESGHWDNLEYKAPIVQKKKGEQEKGAPEDSLMNMMKEMYENGDDDMKRTIAEAWTKAREKEN